jgi:hypothetical protein
LPNPFAEFDYDLLICIGFEIAMVYLAKWSAKVVASKLRNDHLKFWTFIPFFIGYYAITFACLFIEPWMLGLAIATFIILFIDVIIYIIVEKLISKKPFDIDENI